MKLRKIDTDTYINVGIGNVAAVKKRFGEIQIVLSSGEFVVPERALDLDTVVKILEDDSA